MLTQEDIGKRIIIYDTFRKKWEPCNHTLSAIDPAIGMAFLERENHSAWRWPLKYIRVLDY